VDANDLKGGVSDFFSDERRQANLAAVYIFGSAARGSARPDSDVDVGILYQHPPPATLAGQPFELAAELSAALGRTVDVVAMNGAPVDLVKRILRDGVLAVERDRAARVAFEVRARNEYFDLLPFLRLYRRRPVTS
jgi:predicted nucleotidyltransferase